MNIQIARRRMVEEQLAGRQVRDERVLEAFRKVPREEFVDPNLREFAYEDHPLPIGEEQTISQPYIVALMTELLELTPRSRVLEIGTGSGYAAAILATIAAEVYTVERHRSLAEQARERFRKLGYRNIHVLVGDGTRGWPEKAPFDGIVVAAGGPKVPETLRRQLTVGGRLVIPVGSTRSQTLSLIRRVGEHDFREHDMGGVRFVPLLGDQGWPEPDREVRPATVSERVRREAEPFDSIETVDLEPFLNRVGEARVVLMGEASHGTSEFYRMRARMSQELCRRKGFNLICVEADWPDARRIDRFIKGEEPGSGGWTAFSRFPTWMWRNREVLQFANWLKEENAKRERPVSFLGLDLYSLNTSLHQVLEYLDKEDPEAAEVARERYSCLTPWQADPAAYGRAVLSGRYERCEPAVVERLLSRLRKGLEEDGFGYFDAVHNARLVSNAERYYRRMYYGSVESWNLRDSHMFETLDLLLKGDPDARAVVWEHNSHVGDARATEMSARGEHNVGQLVRESGHSSYIVGFGTHAGQVAAASNWGGVMERKEIRPSHPDSFERLFHETGLERFLLPLRDASAELRKALSQHRLERAIGVIYRPETEVASHYFQADLSRQFDEYVWFDRTRPVDPLPVEEKGGAADTYPFGL